MRTRDATIRELLDAETFAANALELNLRDIRRINTFLGWTQYTVRMVATTVQAQCSSQQTSAFSLLDVASGSADMPLAIARWARRHHVTASIVATDISSQIVRVAQQQVVHESMITVEQQDALDLSYPDGAFDMALCSLALHHFDTEQAAALLRNMARVSKTVLVFDVGRSWPAYAGAVLLTQALRMHPMTRHDAPASVRRAYTAPELRMLAQQAGLAPTRIWVGFPFRLSLVAQGTTAR